MTTSAYLRPEARHWRAESAGPAPLEFHRGLPAYGPTPLIELPELAAELEVARVFLKDESSRLGLPAFKILGASYAIARELSGRLGAPATLPLPELRSRLTPGSLRLVAATDGNHGRAVAHVGRLLGLTSTIYVPAEVSPAAQHAIISEGAELRILDLPYDDVVTHAAQQSGPATLVIQDTSWPGYEEIPAWIVDGYTTLVAEVDAALAELGTQADLVVVPAGVGSLAHAVVRHYRSTQNPASVLAVEPDHAPSLTSALSAGRPVRVPTRDTVMTGLNCGTISTAAWPVLREGLDSAVSVSDEAASTAVRSLADLGVDAGPCGAATLAGVRVLASSGLLPAGGVLVLLSTEGRAANPRGSAAD